MLAPIGELEPWESYHSHVDFSGKRATWYYANEVFRVYTLEDDISFGLLTKFDGVPHVVLVCNDLVYTYSQSGVQNCIGLQFTPDGAVKCATGIVFQKKSKVYLLTSPNRFIGLVAPSSTSAVLDGDRLIYFDEGLAVFERPASAPTSAASSIQIFGVRRVQPRVSQKPRRVSLRRHSLLDSRIMSGAEDSGHIAGIGGQLSHAQPNMELELQKEAVISFICEFEVAQGAQIAAQKLDNQQALYVSSGQEVHVLVFEGNKLSSSRTVPACGCAPVEGVLGFPMAVLALLEGNLVLYNGFYDMAIDLDARSTSSAAGPVALAGNTFQLGGRTLFVDCSMDRLVCQCFSILKDLLAPEATLNWLYVYLGHMHRVENSWSAFVLSVLSCLGDDESETKAVDYSYAATDIIVCLHLFREDLLLGTHTDDSVDRLGQLLAFVTSCAGWDWAEYYGEDLWAEQRPTINAARPGAPPNIYSSLSSMLGRVSVGYPSGAFERANACLDVFRVLASPDATVDKLAAVLSGLELGLDQFAECVRIPLAELWAQVEASLGASSPPPPAGSPKDIPALLFPKDRRYFEAEQLLNSSVVPTCPLAQPHTTSDHEWLEILVQYQKPLVVKTLSFAFGSAPLFYSAKTPFLTEALELPQLEHNMLLSETEVQVNFDLKRLPSELVQWSWFHQGTAAGLMVSRDATITGSWIVYNKPDAPTPQHAGFLLGLGLNGHLGALEEWHTYNYMNSKDYMTSVALLIGLSASSLGSMDSKLSKVLSLHIPALLPPNSNDLEVHPDAQVAAVLGVGLLYFGTKYRRMTEVLVAELVKGPSVLSDVRAQSSFYAFGCGVAAGLINLGKGPEFGGPVDHKLVHKLRQAATSISDKASSDSSANAAVMALMLIYLQSNDSSVAEALAPPSSTLVAAYGRPDVLFTRALATHLVMWDSIGSSRAWIQSTLPASLIPKDPVVNSSKLCYLNVLGGIAVAVALRHAGTQDPEALAAVLSVLDELTEWTEPELDEYGRVSAGASAHPESVLVVANTQHVLASVVMAAALIAPSSGNLELLRRLRILQNRKYAYLRSSLLLNLQSAISQAIGMLFVGRCQYSFDRTPETIGLLAVSVGLLSDAGLDLANWLMLRSLWALTATRAALVVRDEQGNHVEEPVMVDGVPHQTPCLVPELKRSIEFDAPGYIPVSTSALPPQGNLVVRRQRLPTPPNLETVLAGTASSAPPADVSYLVRISQDPHRPAHMWSLRLLFAFCDFWTEPLTRVPARVVDQLKLNVWRAAQANDTN